VEKLYRSILLYFCHTLVLYWLILNQNEAKRFCEKRKQSSEMLFSLQLLIVESAERYRCKPKYIWTTV